MRTNATTHDCPICRSVQLCFIDWASARQTGVKVYFCLNCDTHVEEATIRDVTFPVLPQPTDFMASFDMLSLEQHRDVLRLNQALDGPDAIEKVDLDRVSSVPVTMPAFQDEVQKGNALSNADYIDFYERFRKDPLRYLSNQLHARSVAKIVWWETYNIRSLPPGSTVSVDNKKSQMMAFKKRTPERPWGGTVVSVGYPRPGTQYVPMELRGRELVELQPGESAVG